MPFFLNMVQKWTIIIFLPVKTYKYWFIHTATPFSFKQVRNISIFECKSWIQVTTFNFFFGGLFSVTIAAENWRKLNNPCIGNWTLLCSFLSEYKLVIFLYLVSHKCNQNWKHFKVCLFSHVLPFFSYKV